MTQPPQSTPPPDSQGPRHSGDGPMPGPGQQPGSQQPGNQPPAGQQWQPAPSQDARHGAAAPGQSPTAAQQGAEGGRSGPGKGPILAIVGCGLLVLVLLLSLVGFFGVRALMGDGDDEQPTTSQEEPPVVGESTEPEESTEPAEETTESQEEASTESEESPEPTAETAPAGEANTVPKGTVITLEEPNGFAGTLDIAVGDVDWEATEWVHEQNSYNPEPTDQGRYIMVQAEVTYHGPDEFNSFAFGPLDYVAADGTPYEDAGAVTPDSEQMLELTDGQSGIQHFVFMMPADVPEAGHFVIAGSIPLDEVLVEGQWIEAV